MNKTIQNQVLAAEQLGQKKAYCAPSLVRYGDVKSLTQTGTVGPNESNSGSSSGMNCTNTFKQSVSC